MENAFEKIVVEIEKLKSIVDGLRNFNREIPALERNLIRISASVKMLELNFIDPASEGS